MLDVRVLETGFVKIVLALCLAMFVSSTQVMAAKQKIDINTATIEELQTLPNIGPKTAKSIIKYREKHPFESVDELVEVKGIGEKRLKKLKPYVTVSKKKRSSTKKGSKSTK